MTETTADALYAMRCDAAGAILGLAQGNDVVCKGCPLRFVPARSWQVFHSTACRTQYHQAHGHEGVIKASRRLKTVQAIVVHLPPGAEFVPGDRVRLVRA